MNNPTTTPNQDVPTPEGSTGSQAQSTTAPAAPAELAALANGETRDIRLRSLDIQALLTLDKDIESSVPDTIRQGIASYFDRYCIEIFVELPDEVVKLRLYGALGEWDGHSVRYRVDVTHQDETFEVPLLYTPQLDVHAIVNPRLRQLVAVGLAAHSAATPATPDSHSDGPGDNGPSIPAQDQN